MSTLNNVDSVANAKQGSFKPARAPEGPLTDKGVSLVWTFKPSLVYQWLTLHSAPTRPQGQ